MKIVAIVLIGVIATGVYAQNSTNCPNDRWGPGCWNVCGKCYRTYEADRVCDINTGKCSRGCEGEYTGDTCVEAVCKGGCSGGLCIAPDICANCPDINKVAPNCEDIRLRGLIGSAIAFAVITVSITFCGVGSNIYRRRARRRDSV